MRVKFAAARPGAQPRHHTPGTTPLGPGLGPRDAAFFRRRRRRIGEQVTNHHVGRVLEALAHARRLLAGKLVSMVSNLNVFVTSS